MASILDVQASALTGGASGALDAVDGNLLSDGSKATVVTDGVTYLYRLDATSGAAESSPSIISPDSNAGDKRWILQGIRAAALQLATGATPTEFSTDGTLGGDSDTAVPTEKAVKAYVDGVGGLTSGTFSGDLERPQFKYKDTDEIYIGPGRYHHNGTSEQFVYWDSTLTFQFGPGGSNAGSSALAANDFLYLYIDDSAVVAAGTNLITASELVAVTTAPTYSVAKHGWYNGNDRCIGVFLTNDSSQLVEFWHDGGRKFEYANEIEDKTLDTITTSWGGADVTLTAPDFGEDSQALVTIICSTGSSSYIMYRKNGSSSSGHRVGYAIAGVVTFIQKAVSVGSSQAIQFKGDTATGKVGVYTNGYFLPRGA
jgi:hypothetical protein